MFDGLKVLNCTPHEIILRTEDGGDIAIPPSGIVPRVEETRLPDAIESRRLGVRVESRRLGKAEGLPEIEEGRILLVSAMVLDAAGVRSRGDCFAPDTGASCIRNERGHIVAVTGLVS